MRKIFTAAIANSFRVNGSTISLFRNFKPTNKSNLFLAGTFMMISTIGHHSISLNDYYEISVPADLKDGEMKEVQVGPKKEDAVLVAKVGGQYYCVSNKCTHYGAPLSTGILFDDKVKCPWHNATFSVKSGAMDEGPMFDGLQTFPVNVQGDTLQIKIEKSKLNKARTLNMVTRGDDPTHFVILGGGPAGQSAAESLRQGGFRGKITIITKEDLYPYDRTSMSKGIFQVNEKGLQIRNNEFYEKYGIDVKTKTTVQKVETSNNTLILEDGTSVQYDKLLLATVQYENLNTLIQGGAARVPQVTGVNLKNVFSLRSFNDVQRIRDSVKSAKNVVIVGASFIGLESATAIKKELKDAVNVIVVDRNNVAFERVLGREVGGALQDLHEQNGIKFVLGNGKGLQELKGDDTVTKVQLQDGSIIDADFVLLGTGITPNTQFINGVNLQKTDGGVQTDAFLKTNVKNVYAAGDIASFPYWATGEVIRVEHHNEAIYQGFVAAMNMIGNPTPMAQVPFFWTRHWDKALTYSGVGAGYDEVFVDGDAKSLQFIAYYAKNGQVIASASMNKPNAQAIISEALRLNLMPSLQDIKNKNITLDYIKDLVKAKSGTCNCKREGACHKAL